MPVVIVVVGVLVVGVLAYVMWSSDDAPSSTESRFEAFEGDVRHSGTTPDAPEHGDEQVRPQRTDAGPKGSVVVLEDRIERSTDPDTSRGSAASARDRVDEESDGGYLDPVNDEVLGPRRWMAELSDEEREDIDRQLDKPRPEQFPLDLGVRREGIEVAKAVVFDCYDALQRREPGRTGRIIVGFDVVASGSHATLENTEVPTNVDLEDPQFERCITDGIDGLKVSAQEDGEMHVEYPFLFDLEGKR